MFKPMASLDKGVESSKPTTNDEIKIITEGKIIKTAFEKLSKFLLIVAKNMGDPLPNEIKAKLERPQSQEVLHYAAQKLSNMVTKYVLFVCEDGSLKAIQNQTELLLEHVRQVCMMLRCLVQDAGPTQKKILVRTSTEFLEELAHLVDEVNAHVQKVLEYNEKFGTAADQQLQQGSAAAVPTNVGLTDVPVKPSLDSNHSISRLTARVWTTCEKLAKLPLTNLAAVSERVKAIAGMVVDAVREFEQITEDPDQEEPQENEVLSDEEDEDNLLNFESDVLSKVEFAWVRNAKKLVKVASQVICHVGSLLSKATPPTEALAEAMKGSAVSLISEEAQAAKEQIDQFHSGLEDLVVDADMLATYVDRLCSDLYSPQDLSGAARSAYRITNIVAKMLQWMEQRNDEGWFAQAHAAKAAQQKPNPESKESSAAEEKKKDGPSAPSTLEELLAEGVKVTPKEPSQSQKSTYWQVIDSAAPIRKRAWFADGVVIPDLAFPDPNRFSEVEENEWLCKRLTERFQAQHKVWAWLDKMRHALHESYTAKPSLYALYVIHRGGDALNVASDEESEFDYEVYSEDDEYEDEDYLDLD